METERLGLRFWLFSDSDNSFEFDMRVLSNCTNTFFFKKTFLQNKTVYVKIV